MPLGIEDIDTIFVVLVMARWIHFAALFILFGSAFFWLHMGREAWDGRWTRLPGTLAWTNRFDRVAAPVAALSGVAWMVASLATMTGDLAALADPQTWYAYVLETSFGPLILARLVLFGALVAAARAPLPPRGRVWAILASSGSLLVSQAWLGHAAEGGGTLRGASMIAAYALHLLAGAAWLGGLFPLVLAIREATVAGGATRSGTVPRLLSCYSVLAFVAVTAIIGSGIANAAFHMGIPSGEILGSRYATVLFGKIVLVAGMLVLAGVTRLILMPRLRRAPDRGSPVGLVAAIVAEAGLGLLVIGAASILGLTPPPA